MAAPKSEEVEVEDPMDKALKELYYNAEDPAVVLFENQVSPCGMSFELAIGFYSLLNKDNS